MIFHPYRFTAQNYENKECIAYLQLINLKVIFNERFTLVKMTTITVAFIFFRTTPIETRRPWKTLQMLVTLPLRVYQKVFGNPTAVNFRDTPTAYKEKHSRGKHLYLLFPPFIPQLSATLISATFASLPYMHFGLLSHIFIFPENIETQRTNTSVLLSIISSIIATLFILRLVDAPFLLGTHLIQFISRFSTTFTELRLIKCGGILRRTDFHREKKIHSKHQGFKIYS